MIKILPIFDCTDCPRFTDEEEFKGCELSDVRCYDLEKDWLDYLEQFCPLHHLETVVEDAYDLGRQYSEYKKEIIKDVKKSVQSERWVTPHQFLDKVKEENAKKEMGG